MQGKGAHELWRRGRDALFQHHPQSPLATDDALRDSGLRYFPYDPTLRYEAALQPANRPETLWVNTSDGRVRLGLVGRASLPELGIGLDVWWLGQYGGGLFVPYSAQWVCPLAPEGNATRVAIRAGERL